MSLTYLRYGAICYYGIIDLLQITRRRSCEQTEADYYARIQSRSSALDAWKLAHWEQFRQSLRPRAIAWPLPAVSVLAFDNSAPFAEAALTELESFITG